MEHPTHRMNQVIFVIGVSGSGKSLIGRLLAAQLAVSFIDADDHHPPSNVKKMSKGVPLNDADRAPWLDILNQIAKEQAERGCVIACSALKAAYRKQLMDSIEPITRWVYLKGSYDQIYQRMQSRQGHFMKASMLQSQFDTLEAPRHAIVVDIADTPEKIVEAILSSLDGNYS
jgi:6-phosphogluconate dehydrogenase